LLFHSLSQILEVWAKLLLLQPNFRIMALKLFRAVWFLSALVVLADLLYVYAGLPETVAIQEAEGSQVLLDREMLFYVMLVLIAVCNVLVYLISRLYPAHETLRAWFHGLVVTLNIFFIIALSLVSLFNSQERFDYSRIGFVIYGSVGLVVLWALSWPVIRIFGLSRPK